MPPSFCGACVASGYERIASGCQCSASVSRAKSRCTGPGGSLCISVCARRTVSLATAPEGSVYSHLAKGRTMLPWSIGSCTKCT